MYYVIYGKDNCPFCERAKALLTQKGLEFTYLTLGVDYTREELLEMAPDAKTVPQIWIVNGHDLDAYIGGYTDLENHLSPENEIANLLHEGEVLKVTFKKADGTDRVMLCTQNADYITEESTSTKEVKANPNVARVWDIEKSAWRSFRYDSVIEYEMIV